MGIGRRGKRKTLAALDQVGVGRESQHFHVHIIVVGYIESINSCTLFKIYIYIYIIHALLFLRGESGGNVYFSCFSFSII